MTKRDYFNAIKGELKNPDYIAFIDTQIALLDKKASKAKEVAMKKKAEGDALRTSVQNALTSTPASIADIATAVGVSNAKATARLTSLVKLGLAKKDIVKNGKKRMTVYSLV